MRNNNINSELYIKNKWFVITILAPFFLITPFYSIYPIFLLIIAAVFLIYWYIGYYLVKEKKPALKIFKKIMPYIDMGFIVAIVLLRGGLRTDTFLLFPLLIVVYSIFEEEKTCAEITLISMVMYSFCCIFLKEYSQDHFWQRFIVRLTYSPGALFIVLAFKKRLNFTKRNLEKEKVTARKDALTGLWNRKMLDETFDKFIREHRVTKTSFGLLLIDMDNFKNINDEYGHDKGDFVLENVAYNINLSISKKDMLFRIGGDEFLLLVKECDEKKLRLYADRIGESVSRLRFNFNDNLIGITVCVGGSLSEEGNFEKMYKLSDERMYDGKLKGKNIGTIC